MRGPDCPHDGIDQVVRSIEVGSCSLQEEQMLRRSVKAPVGRRNCHGDRLSQSPFIGFAAPHQRQPGLLERRLVCRPATKRLGDVGLRPDIMPRELPGCADHCTRDQTAHHRVNRHLSSKSKDSLSAGTALHFENLSRKSVINAKVGIRRSNLIVTTVIGEPIEDTTLRARIGIGFDDLLNPLGSLCVGSEDADGTGRRRRTLGGDRIVVGGPGGVAGRTSGHGDCPVAGCVRWRWWKLPQPRRKRRPADKNRDASRVRVARSHGQVVGRGLGRRGGWKIEEGWLTSTRRTSSTERTIDPGSARRGERREMAQSPSPSVMPEEAVESGMAGFPEQNAPEQGVGRNGGSSLWGGSTDPLIITGSRANVSAAACVRKVR